MINKRATTVTYFQFSDENLVVSTDTDPDSSIEIIHETVYVNQRFSFPKEQLDTLIDMLVELKDAL